MTERNCINCQKSIDKYLNYCNWTCHLEHAKSLGGAIYTPNNLPIKCIRADGTMLEHEHADHPDYKFPVEIECINPVPLPKWDDTFANQYHALIYTDKIIALTLYESTYFMWRLYDGHHLYGTMYNEGSWRLTNESKRIIDKIHISQLKE